MENRELVAWPAHGSHNKSTVNLQKSINASNIPIFRTVRMLQNKRNCGNTQW